MVRHFTEELWIQNLGMAGGAGYITPSGATPWNFLLTISICAFSGLVELHLVRTRAPGHVCSRHVRLIYSHLTRIGQTRGRGGWLGSTYQRFDSQLLMCP